MIEVTTWLAGLGLLLSVSVIAALALRMSTPRALQVTTAILFGALILGPTVLLIGFLGGLNRLEDIRASSFARGVLEVGDWLRFSTFASWAAGAVILVCIRLNLVGAFSSFAYEAGIAAVGMLVFPALLCEAMAVRNRPPGFG